MGLSTDCTSGTDEVLALWHVTLAKATNNFQTVLDNCTLYDFQISSDATLSTNMNQFHTSSVQSLVHANPQVKDIQYWVVAVVFFMLARILIERYIFVSLGKRLGIKERSNKNSIPCRISSAVPSLENAYAISHKKLSDEAIDKLAHDTGLKYREIERWFRKRRAMNKPSTLIKFSESGWRFVCYVMSASIGIWALWDKPWVSNIELFWENYPNQAIPSDIQFYYMYGSGLYLSFLITQAFDVKRKDFWEMFVHHIITICMLSLTWATGLTRLGTYCLLLHDCADIFLEAAKMANYSKKQDLSTGIFVIFTLIWVVTRLIIYPKNILIYSTPLMMNCLPAHIAYPLLAMALVLFGLHLFWTYFICKLVVSVVKAGNKNQKDSRSSTESVSSSETSPESDSDSYDKRRKLKLRRQSLQLDSGSSLMARIDKKQTARAIMKRISVEIM